MLKIEVGYYDFAFGDNEQDLAVMFARVAREHITGADKKAKVVIKFEDNEEQEEE